MSENLAFSNSKTEVTLNYRQTLYKFDQFEQCWIPRWWILGTWFHYLQKSSVTNKVTLILNIPQNTKNHIDSRLIYTQVSYSGYLSQKQSLAGNSNSLHTSTLPFFYFNFTKYYETTLCSPTPFACNLEFIDLALTTLKILYLWHYNPF